MEFFLPRKKSDLSGKVIPFIKNQRALGHDIQFIRMDNGTENLTFKERAENDGMGLIFEITAPNTPQQNGIVERAFPYLIGKVRAMMEGAGFNNKMKGLLWAECVNLVTKLDNVTPTERDGKTTCSYMQFFNTDKKPPWMNNMKTFGQIAFIANRKKIKHKLERRAHKCIFVGYADEHTGDTYRFYNPATGKIIMNRCHLDRFIMERLL